MMSRNSSSRLAELVLGEQVRGRAARDQPAAVDDQDVVDGLAQLGKLMAGHQHGASLLRERAQQASQPVHAERIESVGRFVEDENGRVAEHCGGEPEPLPHAERVGAHPTVGVPVELDEFENLRNPLVGDHPPRGRAPAARCAPTVPGGTRSGR